jgi:hypothetical protein
MKETIIFKIKQDSTTQRQEDAGKQEKARKDQYFLLQAQ